MAAASKGTRKAFFRGLMVASITCAVLLAIFVMLFPFLLINTFRLFPPYLIAIGGVVSGGLAMYVAQNWQHRLGAITSIGASIGIAAFLYYLRYCCVCLGC